MSALSKLVATALFGGAALVAALLHVSASIAPPKTENTKVSQVAVAHTASSSAAQPTSNNTAVLYADARGHFFADIQVQGMPLRTLVDTGASMIAFSHEDAAKLGFRADTSRRKVQLNTANGVVFGSLIQIPEVRIQSLTVYDVEAVIMPPGAMKGTLLGMSFMKKLTSFEARGVSMVLRK